MSEAFQRVTGGYYRSPEPKDAKAALELWLSILAKADESHVPGMIVLMYLFGRIAARSDEARAAFTPLVEGYVGANDSLAKGVLRTDGLPDVYAFPTDRPEILDLLWAEFFVTGERKPVERIASTLDAADGIRVRLEAMLRERTLGADAAAALAKVGLMVDLEHRIVVTAGDLDCFCYSLAEQRVAIFPLLPFEPAQPALLQLATKGSALWSLRLNASEHPLVAAVCRDEATRPGGKARPKLLEPLDDTPFAL